MDRIEKMLEVYYSPIWIPYSFKKGAVADLRNSSINEIFTFTYFIGEDIEEFKILFKIYMRYLILKIFHISKY